MPKADVSVYGGVHEARQKWRQIGSRRVRSMAKLDGSKVVWIVRRKREGRMANRQIAGAMGVKPRRAQALWARYRHVPLGGIQYPMPMGRPSGGLPGRREHGTVAGLRSRRKGGAARMEGCIERSTGMHIPHKAIHAVLEEAGEAQKAGKRHRGRGWAGWECSHSNMMRHAGFKQLPDGRRFIAYEDDAARYMPSCGVFAEATAANAMAVLHEGMARHGRPASIMADHGAQFFANEASGRRRGEAAFEAELKRLGIRHARAGIAHPQTNGKIERVHREIERHLHEFEAEASLTSTRSDLPGGCHAVGGPFHSEGPKDPIDLFVHWYSHERDHMSLDEG